MKRYYLGFLLKNLFFSHTIHPNDIFLPLYSSKPLFFSPFLPLIPSVFLQKRIGLPGISTKRGIARRNETELYRTIIKDTLSQRSVSPLVKVPIHSWINVSWLFPYREDAACAGMSAAQEPVPTMCPKTTAISCTLLSARHGCGDWH